MATLASKWENLNPRQRAYFIQFSIKVLEIATGIRKNGCGIQDVDIYYAKVRNWIEKDFLAMVIGTIMPVEFLIEYYGVSCEYSYDPEYVAEQISWFNHYAEQLNG